MAACTSSMQVLVITNILQNPRKQSFPLNYFHTNFRTSKVNRNLVVAVNPNVKQVPATAPCYFSIYTVSITS